MQWQQSAWRQNLFRCVKLLHQARFAASSIIPMNNTFFSGAIQVAHSATYRRFSIRILFVYGLAILGYLRLYTSFKTALVTAALLLVARASLGIVLIAT